MSDSLPKRATSFKLSDQAKEILAELARLTGNSKTAVLERLLREEQERKAADRERSRREIENFRGMTTSFRATAGKQKDKRKAKEHRS